MRDLLYFFAEAARVPSAPVNWCVLGGSVEFQAFFESLHDSSQPVLAVESVKPMTTAASVPVAFGVTWHIAADAVHTIFGGAV